MRSPTPNIGYRNPLNPRLRDPQASVLATEFILTYRRTSGLDPADDDAGQIPAAGRCALGPVPAGP